MGVEQNLTLTELGVNEVSGISYVQFLWTSTQTGESFNDYERTAKYWGKLNENEEKEFSVNYTLPKNATKTIVDYKFYVNRRDSGTGHVRFRTWMDTGTSAGVVEKVVSLDLKPIKRASEIKSAKNVTLGESCSVTWTPLSKDFTYKLNFSIGSWSYTTGVISPNTTGDYTYTGTNIPLEVANQITTSQAGYVQVILATYSDKNGTKQLDDDKRAYFVATVPNDQNTQPSVSLSVSSNETGDILKGLYLQGKTQANVSFGAEAKLGATIVSKTVEIIGGEIRDNVNDTGTTFGPFSGSGKMKFKVTAKDSRGYYGTNYKEIDVIPYSRPYVCAKSNENSIIVKRCDASANFTDSGTYLKIKAKIAYTKIVADGVQKNYGYMNYRYRREGGAYSDWYRILSCKTDGSDEVITPPLLNGALDTSSNYHVQIIVGDEIYTSSPITFNIPSESVFMDRPAGGKSIAFGGYSTGDGRMDVYWNLIARGGLSIPDKSGGLIPLDSTLPVPYGQLAAGYDPNNIGNGIHVIANNIALKQGDTVIMYNGVIIQMEGQLGGNVKIQLALPLDENRNPMYRICWYSNWTNWRSMKL